MKKISKIMVTLMALVMAVTLCTVSAKAATKTVKLNKKTVSVYANGQITLKASGITKGLKWSSSNKKVATVSSKGVVTAKKAGKAVITVKAGTKKASCKVTVKKALSVSKIIASVNSQINKANSKTATFYTSSISSKNMYMAMGVNVKKKIIYLANAKSTTGCDKIYFVGKKVYWHSTADKKWYYYTDDSGSTLTIDDTAFSAKGAKAKGYKKFAGKYCKVISITQDSQSYDLYVDASNYEIIGMQQGTLLVVYDLKKSVDISSTVKKATYKAMPSSF